MNTIHEEKQHSVNYPWNENKKGCFVKPHVYILTRIIEKGHEKITGQYGIITFSG